MAEAVADEKKKKISTWRALGLALSNRKSGFMALFGFAQGLPPALFLGTLYAWLSEAEVDLETMGVFSLVGLAYAFQFLWSPLLDKVDIPGLRRLGKRKQWIAPMQLIVGIALLIMSFLDPKSALGWFSLLAAIGAFASATQDIAINAWRIDVADETATLDILSTITQMGFRLAALIGGALGLIIAERIGWPQTYVIMGAIMLGIGIAGLFAPDASVEKRSAATVAASEDEVAELYNAGEVTEKVRNHALIGVGLLWGWAIVTVVVFMVRSMTAAPENRPDVTEFTTTFGPLIVIATVVLPAFIAAWIAKQKQVGRNVIVSAPGVGAGHSVKFTDHLYRALVLPLVEFVGRMGWSLVLILALVLTYRICDSIWGVFAYPFYLGELNYSGDQVAFASKFFGVFAIILGLALGGWIITQFGRMFTLTLGAALAAATNLLYADLAIGGQLMQAGSDAIGFTALVNFIAGVFQMSEIEGLARLTFTIFWENLAIGIAGAAYIAWLSSIVAKKYAAVQYALLASLTLLVGTLGRGALGQMIEERGYYFVFIFTTLIGVIAVILCLAEWYRESRGKAAAGVVAPELGEQAA
ncbi:AmpG family muropeptide MFS transporter [Qipengyuania nanhaisediminis]|uniref:MFS transporter, PAT family, beta-lactamase induction signal transducer AmpG n=1 Tax=Qipengyuania nanhaisediminis TaxID=604088 RepID=A0A1I5Q1J7_9SPHN|nr:MFS transporter [Qipengyuania nanhaisediminis]SFP40103.1 MFS transporter, PAT family, beta-lactamase induction signal transducer AmpG [Qipengyuania nanhaisediminis]